MENEKVESLSGNPKVVTEKDLSVASFGDIVKREPLFLEAVLTNSENVKGKVFLLKAVAKLKNADGEFYVLNIDLDGIDTSFSNGGLVVMKQVRDIIRGLGMDADILKSEAGIGVPIFLTKLVRCVLVLQDPVGKGKKYWVIKDPMKKED